MALALIESKVLLLDFNCIIMPAKHSHALACYNVASYIAIVMLLKRAGDIQY